MKGDFSRDTFDRKRRYSGVLMQQGRVQLDADWNEQHSIHAHRTHAEAVDVIGQQGVPRDGGGFRVGLVGNNADFTLSRGRLYVGGLLCELEEPARVPARLSSAAAGGLTVEYLDGGEGAFAQGQWVEVTAAGSAHSQLRRIGRVDEGSRTLTLNESLTGFSATEDIFVRRLVTYTTQPDHPAPPYITTGFVQDTSPPSSPPTSPPSSPPTSPPMSPPTSPPGGGSPVTSPPVSGDGQRRLDLLPGNYLVYLHAWQRHVTALDDPRLRETALGGPDTTTRVQNVWQVNLLRVEETTADCQTDFARWRELLLPPTGLMNARVQPVEDEKDPCTLPPSAGYRRLENQLYRVEVHRGGARDRATFKWSRDNGSVQTTIERIDNDSVTVSGLGMDEVLGFAAGQWVEVVDDQSEMLAAQAEPRPLLRITGQPDQERGEITLSGSVAHLAGRRGLKLRRWDQSGSNLGDGIAVTAADPAPGSPGWVALEGGVQVSFSAGTYRAGDYWLIPARTATGDIEWPPFEPGGAAPVPQPPHGVRHYYCRLALLKVVSRTQVEVTDCRELFPPLTDITARDVSIDPARCPDLAAAKTVQDAVDILCANRQGPCTQVAIPGPGWEEVFARVGAAEDAEICFQAGEYPLTETVRVSGKGHLKLTGVGPGTRILAPGAEAALVFENCPTVTVRDLYAETGSTGGERAASLREQFARELKAKYGATPSAADTQAIQKERQQFEQHLLEARLRNGTLTFINCATVNVEHVTLKCGAGAVRSSACVTVRGDEKSPNTARVLHCELSVGHRQQGVLLVNVWRSLVEDNVVRVYDKPERLRFEHADVNPLVRAGLRDMLISRVLFGVGETPPTGRNVSLPVTFQKSGTAPQGGAVPPVPSTNPSIHFFTHKALSKEWARVLELTPMNFPKPTRRNLLTHLGHLADRMIVDVRFRSTFPRFKEVFDRVLQQDRAVASQGITVGGRVAREVRVINNTVEGALEGVHVGLSQTAHNEKGIPVRNQFDNADEVTVAGNSILIVLPPDAVKLSRFGIFVGNCQCLRVENNDISLDRATDAADIVIEAVRVWGVLGERVSVSKNYVRTSPAALKPDVLTNVGAQKFNVGIVLQPHPTKPSGPQVPGPAPQPCWLLLENYLDCSRVPRVVKPDSALERDTYPK